MTKFAVHHIQKPAYRLSRELSLGLKDPHSGMERSIDVLMAKDVHDSVEYVAGLEYRCFLAASSIEEAMTISRDDCEQISSMMSLITGLSGGSVQPLVAYPLEKAKVHQFYQYHELEIGDVSVGLANAELFSELGDKLFGLSDQGVLDRVNSSLRFYRKAQEADQVIQRFLLLWLAVEHLDYGLRNRLGVAGGRKCSKCDEPLKCPKCGKLAEAPTTAGLKEFVKIHMNGRSGDFTEAVSLRNKMMHEAKDLTRLSRDIAVIVPFMIEVYLKSLAFVLDHPPILGYSREILGTANVHLNLNVVVEFDAESELAESQDTVPHVQISKLNKTLRYVESGELYLEGKMDMDLVGVKTGCKWRVIFVVVSHGVTINEFKTEWKHRT